MIVSFKCKETQKIYNGNYSQKLPAHIQQRILDKLLMINAALYPEDLRLPPSNRLEKLRGNRQGQYRIRINQQFRICFTWNATNAVDVEVVDYHK
jgi:proteic killer suppression protein